MVGMVMLNWFSSPSIVLSEHAGSPFVNSTMSMDYPYALEPLEHKILMELCLCDSVLT